MVQSLGHSSWIPNVQHSPLLALSSPHPLPPSPSPLLTLSLSPLSLSLSPLLHSCPLHFSPPPSPPLPHPHHPLDDQATDKASLDLSVPALVKAATGGPNKWRNGSHVIQDSAYKYGQDHRGT